MRDVSQEVYPKGGRAKINGWVRSEDGVVEGYPKFVSIYEGVVNEDTDKRSKWVKALQKNGIKMAHPDDGWVDREMNEVMPSYPHFNFSPEVGDLITLGDYDEYRTVKVISKRQGGFHTKESPMIYYRFSI